MTGKKNVKVKSKNKVGRNQKTAHNEVRKKKKEINKESSLN